MIIGESRRDDLPAKRERAEEVFLEHDPAAALTDAFDALLHARGLELLYLTHAEVAIAYLDIVPASADLATLELPEGGLRETLRRPA